MAERKIPAILLILVALLFGNPVTAQGEDLSFPPKTIRLCSPAGELNGILANLNARLCWKSEEFPSVWHLSSGKKMDLVDQVELATCASRNSNLQYLRAERICRSHQSAHFYYRDKLPLDYAPSIEGISGVTRNSAVLSITLPEQNNDAPVKYLEVSAISNGKSTKQIIESGVPALVTVNGLLPGTSYRFKVSAISIDGETPESSASAEISTLPPPPSPPLFELSAETEVGTVDIAITGFTTIQSGGPVETFTIFPEIDSATGLTFDTLTGTLGGTPIVPISETVYTVEGTNESGSHSETFTLTVTLFPAGPAALTWGAFAFLALLWLGLMRIRGERGSLLIR